MLVAFVGQRQVPTHTLLKQLMGIFFLCRQMTGSVPNKLWRCQRKQHVHEVITLMLSNITGGIILDRYIICPPLQMILNETGGNKSLFASHFRKMKAISQIQLTSWIHKSYQFFLKRSWNQNPPVLFQWGSDPMNQVGDVYHQSLTSTLNSYQTCSTVPTSHFLKNILGFYFFGQIN